MRTRAQIEIRLAPRILRRFLKITALAPVRCVRRAARLGHERIKALFGARIGEIVEPIHIERGDDGLNILLRTYLTRFAWTLHDLRHHERGKDAHDHDDAEDFYQPEAAVKPGLGTRDSGLGGGENKGAHAAALYCVGVASIIAK